MFKASKKVMFLAAVVAAFTLAGCASHEAKTEAAPTAAESSNSGINTNGNANEALSRAQALEQQAVANHSIYFQFNKDNIQPQYTSIVDTWAKYLLADPTVHVQVQGNTDDRGTRAYNQALGERRAVSVQSALEAQGVPGSQISTVSFGKERPVCMQNNESCWHQNRRADIVRQ